MDALDRKILDLLRKDGRMPLKEIARILDTPHTTVHFRVASMKKRGIIRGFTVLTDLDTELRHLSPVTYIEAMQEMIKEQREAVDNLWDAVKILARRLEAGEKKV